MGSFFGDLGKALGEVAGAVVAAPVMLAGEITGSQTLKDVAEGAFKVTANTGKIVGKLADGTVKCADGILSNDSRKIDEGLGEVIETSAKTIYGIGKGVAKTIDSGIEVIQSVADGDVDRAVKTGKQIAVGVAAGMIGFGVGELFDVLSDGVDLDGDGIPDDVSEIRHIGERDGLDFVYKGEPPRYWIDAPHTANGGYWRTMPDASVSNNLSAQ